jgi:glycosyltransferase involved in cell wall biosynthesis
MSACFLMLSAYPTILGKGEIGGAELQSWMIARGLASNGHDVRFLVKSKGSDEKRDGVKIRKIWYTNFLISYLFVLREILQSRSDVYYQRTGGHITIFISLVCRLLGKRFIFHVSGNRQLLQDYPYNLPWFLRKLYSISLKLADTIIVQNSEQRRMLKRRNVQLVPNIIKLGKPDPRRKKDYIIWVGSFDRVKQPEIYLALAERLPKYRFLMIGRHSRGKHSSKVLERGKPPRNLNILGQKPFSETERYISEARVFVNTSSSEGFPNTFLQSWKYGTPVVSLSVDPDNIISKNALGFFSGSLDRMADDVRKLMENDSLWKEMSHNCESYVKKHDISSLFGEFEKVFTK